MSYILCDMDCDQEINKSNVEEHCSDCLCVGELVDEDQQEMRATKAWRSTSVVKGRGHPKTEDVHVRGLPFSLLKRGVGSAVSIR